MGDGVTGMFCNFLAYCVRGTRRFCSFTPSPVTAVQGQILRQFFLCFFFGFSSSIENKIDPAKIGRKSTSKQVNTNETVYNCIQKDSIINLLGRKNN